MVKKKLKIITLAVSAVCTLSIFAACGEKTIEPCKTHSWDGGVVTAEATCGEHGLKTYTCTVCGATKTDAFGAATGNHSYDNGTCTVCGYVDMNGLTKEAAIQQYGYYHVDADESSTVSTGDEIYFGSYPQQKVSDAALLSTLNAEINDSAWTSYEYFVEGESCDVMLYQDVEANGSRYRAVKIDDYRPSRSDGETSKNYVSENGFQSGNTYWFAFAPIEWRVLDYINGEAFLNAVKCLDAQAFQNTFVKEGTVYYGDADKTTYANNWENSDIRTWLNQSFLQSSFSATEQSKIVAKTLDNKNTGYDATAKYNSDQKETTDKVYLLSYTDILNAEYGFPVSEVTGAGHSSIEDLTVCKTGTDYALCQGLRTSAQSANANGEPCSWWMLRSAGGTSFSLCGVSKYGTLSKSNTTTFTDEDAVVVGTNSGISPAINLKIGK